MNRDEKINELQEKISRLSASIDTAQYSIGLLKDELEALKNYSPDIAISKTDG